jgi:hypothetical protein
MMFSADTHVSKRDTAGKRNHVTLRASQKLEIFRRLEDGES